MTQQNNSNQVGNIGDWTFDMDIEPQSYEDTDDTFVKPPVKETKERTFDEAVKALTETEKPIIEPRMSAKQSLGVFLLKTKKGFEETEGLSPVTVVFNFKGFNEEAIYDYIQAMRVHLSRMRRLVKKHTPFKFMLGEFKKNGALDYDVQLIKAPAGFGARLKSTLGDLL